MDHDQSSQCIHTQKGKSIFFLVCAILVLFFIGASAVIRTLNTAPSTFPIHTSITIEDGLSIRAISNSLEQSGVIRSSLYLYYVLQKHYTDRYVQAGTYQFDEPLTTRDIAEALTTGTHLSPLLSVTLPEGFRASEILTYLPQSFALSSTTTLESQEGYLFPDTYFVATDATLDDLVVLLQDTFNTKLLPYASLISESGFTQKEVIILASIIEREAKDEKSMKLVSGILQNRLKIDMPLQVDATFDYILGKSSHELSMDDLAIDSPFNTYTHAGLPPAPISNPGLASIEAVLFPTETDYLYYLTAQDGTFHYANDFEGHKLNKERYLR